MQLKEWHNYFIRHNNALKKMAKEFHDPWVFLCGAATIGYLARMSCNEKSYYVKFIREYMSKVDKRYRDFKYKNGKCDLPEQMFYILRNGLVHAFTLKPLNDNNKGRINSIILSHDKAHFTADIKSNRDSCVFNAHQFINDIGKTIDIVFEAAKTNEILDEKMKYYFSEFPPLMPLD